MDGIFECPFLTGNWGSLSLNLLEAAMFYGDTSWNFPNTRSPFNRIYFMMDGEAYLENEEERVELLPGNVYLVPAGVPVQLRVSQHHAEVLYPLYHGSCSQEWICSAIWGRSGGFLMNGIF